MGRTKTSAGGLPPESELLPFWVEPAGPLKWAEVFGNTRPVEVEVGSGKGLFLVSAATQFSNRNFLGIEISPKFARFTAARLSKSSLSNARIVCGDARRMFTEWIGDASVAAVHVYFPDPWWKRRHKKRRIFTESFLGHAERILEPGGQLRVASDVEEYFEAIRELVGKNPAFVPIETELPGEPENESNYLTNFERKYRKSGRQVFKAYFQKVADR